MKSFYPGKQITTKDGEELRVSRLIFGVKDFVNPIALQCWLDNGGTKIISVEDVK